MTQVLALLNNKGGVGKTATAVNLAAGFASAGLRTLLVDLDSQGSASACFGMSAESAVPSIASVLIEGKPIGEVVRRGIRPNLDLVPAEMTMAHFDVNAFEREKPTEILEHELAPVLGQYEMIVLDGPPGFSLLTTNIVRAADSYIVPLTLEYLAALGLRNLVTALDEIEEATGATSKRLGILVTKYRPWLNLSKEFIVALRDLYPGEVFDVSIPDTVKVAECTGHGKTIYEYDRQCNAAAAYRLLTDEVMARCGARTPKTAARTRSDGLPTGAQANSKTSLVEV